MAHCDGCGAEHRPLFTRLQSGQGCLLLCGLCLGEADAVIRSSALDLDVRMKQKDGLMVSR